MNKEIEQSIKGDGNTQVSIGNFNSNLTRIPSVLAKILPKITELLDVQSDEAAIDFVPYEIQEKITHNEVSSFQEFINRYGEFGTQIDTIYEEYDENSPGAKQKIFRYFSTKYSLKLERLLSENKGIEKIVVIRKHADDILREIFDVFISDLKATASIEVDMEDIDACALAVVCHAFVGCKILEKPESDNR